MEFIETTLKDAKIIVPFVSHDVRGSFIKDFHTTEFKNNGIDFTIKENLMTQSKKGVLRGMHMQLIKPQGKIVRCLSGKVYDYIVDLRKDSPTYMKGEGFILDDINNYSLFVPRGFAHGYYVLEDSLVLYKCDEEFYKDGDISIRYDDEDLKIDWQFIVGTPIRSEKDLNGKSFKYYESML